MQLGLIASLNLSTMKLSFIGKRLCPPMKVLRGEPHIQTHPHNSEYVIWSYRLFTKFFDDYNSHVEPHIAYFECSFTPNLPSEKLGQLAGASTFKSCYMPSLN